MINGLTSVIMPTTGRKDMAVAYIQRILETTEGHDIEIICIVDADTETRDALLELDGPIQVIFREGLHGAPKSWNRGLKESQGEFIMLATDDGWPHEGWLDAAKRAMSKLPPGGGFVGFNDLHNDGNRLATSGLYSRRFILDYLGGCLAFECYGHFFQDTEVNRRAKAADRFIYAEDSIIEHLHPASHKREPDETYRRNLTHWEHDIAVFRKRESAGFPIDYEPAIKDNT